MDERREEKQERGMGKWRKWRKCEVEWMPVFGHFQMTSTQHYTNQIALSPSQSFSLLFTLSVCLIYFLLVTNCKSICKSVCLSGQFVPSRLVHYWITHLLGILVIEWSARLFFIHPFIHMFANTFVYHLIQPTIHLYIHSPNLPQSPNTDVHVHPVGDTRTTEGPVSQFIPKSGFGVRFSHVLFIPHPNSSSFSSFFSGANEASFWPFLFLAQCLLLSFSHFNRKQKDWGLKAVTRWDVNLVEEIFEILLGS